jgi:hypothetical protein
MNLTDEEIALASKLNFDPDVLSLVKTTLKVPLREFEGARSMEYFADIRDVGFWTPEVKQYQISILKKIADRSPDAVDLISAWIDKLAGPLTDAEQSFFDAEARNKKFRERSAPYADYLAAEWSRILNEGSADGIFEFPSFMQDVGNGASVEDRLRQMKEYFADKPKPQPKQQPEPKTVEKGVVLRVATLYWGPQRALLSSALKKARYKLTELSNYRENRTYWSKPEADDYAASVGRIGMTGGGGGSRAINPTPYKIGTEDNTRRLFEGDETISRVGPDAYEVLAQTRFVVNFPVSILLLTASGKTR